MDRLGFVRTVEAILAAVVALNIYNFLITQNNNQIQTIDRLPNIEINDFLNVINLNDIVNDYDYLRLDSLFNKLFFETMYFYYEPVYYDKIIIRSNETVSWPNISFVYHFPKGVDENSIRILSDNHELRSNASFNWFSVPVTFNESIINEYVSVNFSLSDSGINNNSLMFFVNNKRTILSLDYWNEDSGSTNFTVTVYIPSINTTDRGFLLFSKNFFNNLSYPSLTASKVVNSTIYNVQKARTATIIFSPDSLNSSSKDFFIRYSLFSNEDDYYDNFNEINNSGVYFNVNEVLKSGTIPYTASIKGSYLVKKIVPLTDGFVELRVYGGFS